MSKIKIMGSGVIRRLTKSDIPCLFNVDAVCPALNDILQDMKKRMGIAATYGNNHSGKIESLHRISIRCRNSIDFSIACEEAALIEIFCDSVDALHRCKDMQFAGDMDLLMFRMGLACFKEGNFYEMARCFFNIRFA
jgi:hypothetical protein